jgi:hypothetical protein
MLQLREAARLSKPIVAALVDDAGGVDAGCSLAPWWPKIEEGSPEERELAALLGGSGMLLADLRSAAAAECEPPSVVTLGDIASPLKRSEALPKLVQLVGEALGRRVRSSRGGGSAESSSAPESAGGTLASTGRYPTGSQLASTASSAAVPMDPLAPRGLRLHLCSYPGTRPLAYRQARGGYFSSDRGLLTPQGAAPISPTTHEVSRITIFTRVDKVDGPYDRPVGWQMHWRLKGDCSVRGEIAGKMQRGAVGGLGGNALNGLFYSTTPHEYRLEAGEWIENFETADRGVHAKDGHCPWCVACVRITIRNAAGTVKRAPELGLGKLFTSSGVQLQSAVEKPGPIFGFEGGVGDYIDRMEPLQWRDV